MKRIKLKAVVLFIMASGAVQAQTAIDLSKVQMKAGTQSLISPNDMFSMNGDAHVIELPPCPAGQHWQQWNADPSRPNFKAAYVLFGTAPDRARFSWRDPSTGKSLGHQTTALVCDTQLNGPQ